MKIRVRAGDASSVPAELTIVPITSDDIEPSRLRRVLGGAQPADVRRALAAAAFKGREGDTLLVPLAGGKRVALIGVGARARLEVDSWRRAAGRGRRHATELGVRRAAFVCDAAAQTEADLVAVVEGFSLAAYRFDKYKSRPDPAPSVDELILIVGGTGHDTRALDTAWRRTEIVLESVAFVRDLVNEPAAVKTPSYIAAATERLAKDAGFGVEVWKPDRLAKEEMHGLIAVARGAEEEPRFLRMRYEASGASKRIALVGKGITFDSGGLSLKQAKSMETMKIDMAGGAAVIAVMAAVARLRPLINVDGFVPLSENLPSGAAQKPGDVIRYRNGKTVEVLNTAAEGRLVLADALTLAAALQPDAIIDVATLTGACMVALGVDVAGVFSNDQRLADDLVAIGRAQGEPLWQLPLVPEYRDDLKSAVADLKNIGGGNAGSITGALFLQEFVDGRPWAHLDIAGPAYADKDKPYQPRGGTGFAVRTLVEYVLRSAATGAETAEVARRPARKGPTIEASQAPSRRGRGSASAESRNERPTRPTGRRVPTGGRDDRADDRGRPGGNDASPSRRAR